MTMLGDKFTGEFSVEVGCKQICLRHSGRKFHDLAPVLQDLAYSSELRGPDFYCEQVTLLSSYLEERGIFFLVEERDPG